MTDTKKPGIKLHPHQEKLMKFILEQPRGFIEIPFVSRHSLVVLPTNGRLPKITRPLIIKPKKEKP